MAVGVQSPSRAEWVRYAGRHATVLAPPGSFAATRAPQVLQEAERTVTELLSGGSDPVITKKPEGAWTSVVTDAAKAM